MTKVFSESELRRVIAAVEHVDRLQRFAPVRRAPDITPIPIRSHVEAFLAEAQEETFNTGNDTGLLNLTEAFTIGHDLELIDDNRIRNRTKDNGGDLDGVGRDMYVDVAWNITLERLGSASVPPASVDGKVTMQVNLRRDQEGGPNNGIVGAYGRISTTTVDQRFRGGSAGGFHTIKLHAGASLVWFIFRRYSGGSDDQYKTWFPGCSVRVKEVDSYPPPDTIEPE